MCWRVLLVYHRAGAPTGDVLRGVAAWLVLNSMASDKIQFQQLLVQNAANVRASPPTPPVDPAHLSMPHHHHALSGAVVLTGLA